MAQGMGRALRLGENNDSILDYVLLPSVSLSFSGPFFWFSEDTLAEHGIERFKTFEELSRSLIKRQVVRSTKTESRSKAKGVSGSGKGRRL
jgi:hypothetical protein